MLHCPKCGGADLWDNRRTKTNPKAPDYKCKKRNCNGVIWPEQAHADAPQNVNAAIGYEPDDPGPYDAAIPVQQVQQVPQVQRGPRAQPRQAGQTQPASLLPSVSTVSGYDYLLMKEALYAAVNLTAEIAQDPSNADLAFTSDNICSIAATFFIETRKQAR